MMNADDSIKRHGDGDGNPTRGADDDRTPTFDDLRDLRRRPRDAAWAGAKIAAKITAGQGLGWLLHHWLG